MKFAIHVNIIVIVFLPFTNCECNVETAKLHYSSPNYGYENYHVIYTRYFNYFYGLLINCTDISLNGGRPLKTYIKSEQVDQSKKANYVNIINSSIPVIEDSIFDAFTSVKNVFIDNSNIIEIREKAFGDMDNLTELNLPNNKLTKIKNGALNSYTKLKTLNLFNNTVNTLDNINQLKSLEILNLSYNEINELSESSFRSLNSLKVLDLSSNLIAEVNINFFENLNNLNTLILSNNTIETFHHLKFKQPIIKLDLSSNLFLDTPDIRANESTIIYNLDLCDNFIDTLKKHNFKNFEKISTLNLSMNIIREIHEDAFESLSNLTTLTLAYNDIYSLYPGTFHQLSALTVLNISWNRIETFSQGIFTGLRNLQVLDISNNELKAINPTLFYPIKNLQELYVHGNLLKNINSYTISYSLPNLKHISIDFVQIGCASLTYALKRFKSESIAIKEFHHVKTHNVHGIQCDPNIKEIERDNYDEQILKILANFTLIYVGLILLVIITILFLIIKTVTLYNINFAYCKNKFMNRGLHTLSENDQD